MPSVSLLVRTFEYFNTERPTASSYEIRARMTGTVATDFNYHPDEKPVHRVGTLTRYFNYLN